MTPERRALLDALTVERFTPYRPTPDPISEQDARRHREDAEPRLRLVRDQTKPGRAS